MLRFPGILWLPSSETLTFAEALTRATPLEFRFAVIELVLDMTNCTGSWFWKLVSTHVSSIVLTEMTSKRPPVNVYGLLEEIL